MKLFFFFPRVLTVRKEGTELHLAGEGPRGGQLSDGLCDTIPQPGLACPGVAYTESLSRPPPGMTASAEDGVLCNAWTSDELSRKQEGSTLSSPGQAWGRISLQNPFTQW